MCLVSVVIPVYNVEDYIVDCLNSIQNQSFKQFEVVIVNDGSTDSTMEIVNDYLKNVSFKYTVINQQNRGIAASRNVGLNASKGKYIIFVDSDDMLKSNCLERMYSICVDKKADMCCVPYTHDETFQNSTDDICTVLYNRQEMSDIFLKRKKVVFLSSTMFNRDFINGNGILFDEKCKYSEDLIFLWSCIFATNKIAYCNEQMYFYRRRPNSIMTSAKLMDIFSGIEQFEFNVAQWRKKYGDCFADFNYIENRWKLGVIRSSSMILDKKSYAQLYKKVCARDVCLQVLKVGILKERVYALTGIISPWFIKAVSKIGVRWL